MLSHITKACFVQELFGSPQKRPPREGRFSEQPDTFVTCNPSTYVDSLEEESQRDSLFQDILKDPHDYSSFDASVLSPMADVSTDQP